MVKMSQPTIGDLCLIRPHMGNFYYGQIVSIDSDCILINNASYGQNILTPGISPLPGDHFSWTYWCPKVELMFMKSSIFWIAKATAIPILPDGVKCIKI